MGAKGVWGKGVVDYVAFEWGGVGFLRSILGFEVWRDMSFRNFGEVGWFIFYYRFYS